VCIQIGIIQNNQRFDIYAEDATIFTEKEKMVYLNVFVISNVGLRKSMTGVNFINIFNTFFRYVL
jgi:hypothetical protein